MPNAPSTSPSGVTISHVSKSKGRKPEKGIPNDTHEQDEPILVPRQKSKRLVRSVGEVVVATIELEKTPEEIAKHNALIAYLKEDYLNHYPYFPSISEISFDRFGCPIILQTYRERLSLKDRGMTATILDSIGDFIFKR